MKKLILGLGLLGLFTQVSSQNSVQIGQSSNAFGMLRTSQNQIFVDPVLNTVGFVYRQNNVLYGNGNGRLRYSISLNAGATWNTELGVLNNTYTRPGRYPQSWLYNPTGNTDPLASYILWTGPTIPASFDGLVSGVCNTDTANPVSTTENYLFQNSSSFIPGGLCESTTGIFWMVENTTTNDTTILDSINVYRGTFGSGDVNWVKHAVLYAPHSRSFDGTPHYSGPNIAFSPNGQVGYIVFLGDINGADSTYNPIIYKSSDAGATWGAPNELIVDNIPAAVDSIKQFLFDTGTAIESATEVATAFECDITVDINNNLHIFTTLCAVERRDTFNVVTGAKQYSVYSGYPKNAVDIYTTDGGTTWTSHYVSQINQFRTTVPVNTGTLSVDNYNQISRTKDGDIIFYSWSDTDTLIHTGSTTNSAPNTFTAGFDVVNNTRTCWKQIAGVSNEDFVITPTMAPFVLEDVFGGPRYTLPIVTQEILGSDGLSPTNYYYVGRGARFCDEDFMATVNLSWNPTSLTSLPYCYNYNSCFAADIQNTEETHFKVFPNPASNLINVELKDLKNITGVSIVNQMGQIMRVISVNEDISTLEVDITGLANGMYSLNINSNGKTYSEKFTVIK